MSPVPLAQVPRNETFLAERQVDHRGVEEHGPDYAIEDLSRASFFQWIRIVQRRQETNRLQTVDIDCASTAVGVTGFHGSISDETTATT
jgi:hypothetical protein